MAKYGESAGKNVESAMRRRKRGTLKKGKGGKGGKVKSRKQAIAIGLSEAREKGGKVPPKKGGSKKRSTKKGGAKKRSTKKGGAKKRSTKKGGSKKGGSKKRSSKKRGSKK